MLCSFAFLTFLCLSLPVISLVSFLFSSLFPASSLLSLLSLRLSLRICFSYFSLPLPQFLSLLDFLCGVLLSLLGAKVKTHTVKRCFAVCDLSGEVTTFSEVLAGDETGTIKLELHGEEQRTACRPGSVVLLLRATTAQVAGEMSLRILPRVGGAILPAEKEINIIPSEGPCLSDVPLLSLNAAVI
ncbi:putative transmembrane protein [Toxoplasma gondii RUB]|uniref:Putative transmembrane protein n=1 Tax=Toxoplasma gondii RUB TaxID=935652 RepID=A0A086M5U8_TOXGO|nr:putative transmembrane protein [Toxoplasma gondii RUB]